MPKKSAKKTAKKSAAKKAVKKPIVKKVIKKAISKNIERQNHSVEFSSEIHAVQMPYAIKDAQMIKNESFEVSQFFSNVLKQLNNITNFPFPEQTYLLTFIPACSETSQQDKEYFCFAYHLNHPDFSCEDNIFREPLLVKGGVDDIDIVTGHKVTVLQEITKLTAPEDIAEMRVRGYSSGEIRIQDTINFLYGKEGGTLAASHYCGISEELKKQIAIHSPKKIANLSSVLHHLSAKFSPESTLFHVVNDAKLREFGWAYTSLFDIQNDSNIEDFHFFEAEKLYMLFHNVSTARLEGEASKGHVILAPRIFAQIDIPFDEIEDGMLLLRKLLPLTTDDKSVLCDVKGPYGLGRLLDKEEINIKKRELSKTDGYNDVDCIKVTFQKHGHWSVEAGDILAIEYRYGNIEYEEKFDFVGFTLGAIDIFEKAYGKDRVPDMDILGLIKKLVEKIKKVKHHGTTLVFHVNPVSEVDRLRERGIPIKQLKIHPDNAELLNNMIHIDGAVMFDFSLTCHAIGIILDGVVDAELNNNLRTRGARYNSLRTYIDSQKGLAIAVVFSEDGAISIMK